jgi:hypothetical protein
MCFPEYGAKMDGLRGVSNLLGDKAPMQFASSIFMSDWRSLHHTTVATGDAFCICMSKYMPRALPYTFQPHSAYGDLHAHFA